MKESGPLRCTPYTTSIHIHKENRYLYKYVISIEFILPNSSCDLRVVREGLCLYMLQVMSIMYNFRCLFLRLPLLILFFFLVSTWRSVIRTLFPTNYNILLLSFTRSSLIFFSLSFSFICASIVFSIICLRSVNLKYI